MLYTIVASALSLVSISVPYVPQTDALCGGAAAAMVYRYWGDAHAAVEPFASLVERRPGGVTGIASDVLANAVRSQGWKTERADPSIESLRARIDRHQPVIVLIADRRDLFHYVVVVGVDRDAVIVHDPSWGPSRRLAIEAFDRVWAAARHWSLVILPDGARLAAPQPDTSTSAASTSSDGAPLSGCDVLLRRAIDEVTAGGIDRADAVLESVRQQCPHSAGPLRELAGVRFAQKRWNDAEHLAREALTIDPRDEYALEVLGSSRFMQNDDIGALRAWNQIGRPRLDLVHIEGLHHSRYQTISEALRLEPNRLLTADAFKQAKHRLDELPDRSSARLTMRPDADGFASLDVVIAERSGRPRGISGWTGTAVRAGIDRELAVTLPGFTGQGEVWSASWRWWRNRPRVAFGFAAPRVGRLPGVWRVEASWDVESYGAGDSPSSIGRESRRHGDLSVADWITGDLRYSLTAGVDAWNTGRRAASLGGSLERRWFDDRLSISGDATSWLGLSGSGFHTIGLRARARSSQEPRRWIYEGAAGMERASDSAPLALWPGAGEGRARAPLLRAHPMLDDGVIDTTARSAFGRSIVYGSAEAQRWFARPALVRVGAAAFVDVARAARRSAGGSAVGFADVGAGLRVRVPGLNRVLRIDLAHGLRDGADAFTVGWVF
jgi:hypothetical protein